MKPRVYSYLRFSDPKQANGTSAARQMEYASRWAADHDLTLDASFTLRDEGLSAYRQRHVKQGALGTFLRAVEEGRIPAGSVLIVEGLDRLSRAEPLIAQGQLAQIINGNVTVVTACDNREYNARTLKAQPMDLVYSLLVMIRAHEESETKSQRVRAAIRRRCEGWVNGDLRTVFAGGHDPRWIEWVPEKGYVLVERHATVIRSVIGYYRQGYGTTKIMQIAGPQALLAEAGVSAAPRIHRIMENRALIGEKTLMVDGKSYVLKDYYPALLTEAEFAELQHMMRQRGRRAGKGEIPGIVTGLRIAHCGYCGGPMTAQNSNKRNRQANGLPQDGHRRIICSGHLKADRCDAGSCSIVPIERALMNYCADQMNLDALLKGSDRISPLAGKLALARERVAKTQAQIDRLTEALLEDEAAAPASFTRKARQLEAQLVVEQEAVATLEHELATTRKSAVPTAAKAWANLVKGVEMLDAGARLQARQLVADTFERIAIYHHGFRRQAGSPTIDMLLVSKAGVSRLLHVDRKTGAWRAGSAVNLRAVLNGHIDRSDETVKPRAHTKSVRRVA
ncbi:recombinase family protein [Paraburkholderia adhaesiva]|uniref:recombinase family protein n=1 Tax=Paraburkholderia adhaesiva TaxID=2883244 RepID=UPI001F22B14F|nr:recombinase family protein [Paraburkholderia adhaesiva]